MEAITVAGLWRFPVKSLAGEALEVAHLTRDGMAGDRVVHVRGPRGPLTGRVRHGLVTIRAWTDSNGVPRVGGHPWTSPEALALIEAEAGPGTELVAFEGPERFDVTNLLVATDGAVADFGYDLRRLRPNLLLRGVVVEEADLVGRALAIGDAVIGVHSVRARCIVTAIDPDSGAVDLRAYRRIKERFDGKLALNCWVVREGRIRVGDAARVVPLTEGPRHVGGWIVGAPYNV